MWRIVLSKIEMKNKQQESDKNNNSYDTFYPKNMFLLFFIFNT